MATSRRQTITTIDKAQHRWYKQIAKQHPLFTMMGMMREAHTIYQENYALLNRVQRQLRGDGVKMSSAELIGRLLRMVIYKKVEITIVNDRDYYSNAV